MDLNHLDVALIVSGEVLAAGDRPLSQFKSTWQSARPEDRLDILAVRSRLLDYLGAGYITGDTERYNAACDAMLEQAPAFIDQFQPSSEILLVELCLAIVVARPQTAMTLARALANEAVTGGPTLDHFQAKTLAALVLQDQVAARENAAKLRKACIVRGVDRLSCAQGLHWTAAVQHLAESNHAEARLEIDELLQLNTQSIDRELAKLKRGGPSAFAPFDLLEDLPAAALLHLIEAEEVLCKEGLLAPGRYSEE